MPFSRTPCEAPVARRAGPPPQAFLLRQVAAYVTRILGVLGVAGGRDELGLGPDGASSGGGAAGEGAAPVLDAFADFRTEVRSLAKAALNGAGGGGVADALKQLLAVSDRCVPTPSGAGKPLKS